MSTAATLNMSNHSTTSHCDTPVSCGSHLSPPEIVASRHINTGVTHFECGNIELAVAAFADALSTSRQLLPAEGDHNLAENHLMMEDDDDDAENDDGPFQPQFGRSEMVKSTTATSDICIFLNPIKIPTNGSLSVPSKKVHKTLSLITMFNLAICHHRNAIENNMDKTYLRKALQLYELAYSIQVQGGIDMTLTPTMIIMSNVGHIHDVLGNDDNAKQCFQHLLSTLMFLIEAGERDRVWEFDGFFNNIMQTIYANSPAAAA